MLLNYQPDLHKYLLKMNVICRKRVLPGIIHFICLGGYLHCALHCDIMNCIVIDLRIKGMSWDWHGVASDASKHIVAQVTIKYM